MKKQTINTTEDNEQIISSKTYNEDRTMAFKVYRQPHKSDNIGWVVGSFLMFVTLVFSVSRFTIIGQVIDDTLFSFVFGWAKYLAYLFLFGVNFAILFGLKFKFKFLFLTMIIFLWVAIVWIISTTEIWFTSPAIWIEDSFNNTMNKYITNWKNNSVFGSTFQEAPMFKFLFWNYVPGYVNLGQSGGIVGVLLTGSIGYLSLPTSLAFALIFLFFVLVWILTGNPIYIFLPKKKRKGRRLRLLALKNKNNPHVKQKPREIEVETFKQPSQANIVVQDQTNIKEELQQKETLWDEITMMNQEQDMELKAAKTSFGEDSTFEFKNYEQELEQLGQETQIVQERNLERPKLKSKAEFFEEQKAEFESLNPDEVRQKFAKEFSDIRPFGDLEAMKQANKMIEPEATVKEFVPFKEASLDDTDFLNDLAAETNLPELHDEPSTTDLIVVEETQKETNFQPYILPDINLLDDVKQERRLFHENQTYAIEKQQAIDETFNQFKVAAKVVNITYGSSVIKFEIQPEPGTKVNSISALENDLKLALASQNMRIEAPIPGKNLVGIEIENKHRLLVGLKELMVEANKVSSSKKLLFALGKDTENKPVFGDLTKMPHLLVAGSTGSGKSVMINSLIISLLMRATPKEVKLLLIDPKKVELSIYTHLPHMLMPVISNMKEANKALKVVIAEMERRYDLFANNGAKNLESYNKKQDRDHQLPYYVVIIDELADLMMTVNRKEVEDSIMRITQMARAAGIHLIVATQRPSVDVITGVIKANIPTRIAFSVTTGTDSRTILDSMGAEKLTGRGDMLYIPPGTSELVRAQGAYLSDEEIERVINFISRQQHANYQQSFLNQMQDNNLSFVNNESDDQFYQEVKNFVIVHQKASITLLQRKFAIGYNKAANLIDQLEAEGIIGPSNGAKGREVLVES